jgi:hypothetical protein
VWMAHLASSQGQQAVKTAPGGGDASSVGLVVAQVEVAGKEQNRSEHHGQGLERARMLGGDQGGQESGRHGVFCLCVSVCVCVCVCVCCLCKSNSSG